MAPIIRFKGKAVSLILLLAIGAACGDSDPVDVEPREDNLAAAPVTIDTRRSLVVTEQPILDRFPLSRVLDQLVLQSGEPGLTSLSLFNQWWDTQILGPV